jgi:hypothetical protein
MAEEEKKVAKVKRGRVTEEEKEVAKVKRGRVAEEEKKVEKAANVKNDRFAEMDKLLKSIVKVDRGRDKIIEE